MLEMFDALQGKKPSRGERGQKHGGPILQTIRPPLPNGTIETSSSFEASRSSPVMFKRRKTRAFHVYQMQIEKHVDWRATCQNPSSAQGAWWSFFDLDSKGPLQMVATETIKRFLFKRDTG